MLIKKYFNKQASSLLLLNIRKMDFPINTLDWLLLKPTIDYGKALWQKDLDSVKIMLALKLNAARTIVRLLGR